MTSDLEPPAWLRDALTHAPDPRETDADGVRVRWYRWGERGGPGVLLIHGGLCHAHWWDHIAPLLTGCDVVAADLSGNGDSTYTGGPYGAHRWAREMLAVMDDAGLSRPIVVGHSMGGHIALALGANFPDRIGGVITVDTRFNDNPYGTREKPSSIYSSLEEGISRFNPVYGSVGLPVDPVLWRHIAETSLSSTEGGWRWKRDDRFEFEHVRVRELLPDLIPPLAIIRTEFGLVTTEMAAEMRGLVAGPSTVVEIPAASHNPHLEQPVAFVATLRTLIGSWFPAVREPVIDSYSTTETK